jgi:hypothetical protein
MRYYLPLLFLFLFAGCSSKHYFEPINHDYFLDDNVTKVLITPDYIRDINAKSATLDNNMFLDKNGISKKPLPKGYFYLNLDDDNFLAVNKHKQLLILKTGKVFTFKSDVISATSKGNILALVFANNSIGIYDTNIKQFKLKRYLKPSPLNDTRITMPIFLDKIILIPTLSGQIIVVDSSTYKVIKTLNIDPESEIKNIVLLETSDNILLAGSPNKILSIGSGTIHKKEFFIQSYNMGKKYLYVASLDGTVYKFDLLLNIVDKKKFKYAKFQAIAIGKNDIYLVESQGYIVRLSKDFKKVTTYSFPFDEDEKIFSTKNKLYIEDKLLIVK